MPAEFWELKFTYLKDAETENHQSRRSTRDVQLDELPVENNLVQQQTGSRTSFGGVVGQPEAAAQPSDLFRVPNMLNMPLQRKRNPRAV